jgi:hypothetical protein
MKKIIADVHARDINPTDNRSDSAILRQHGYAKTTKPGEVFNSKAYLTEYELFYKNKKTPDQIANQLAAKARRNVFEGLDSVDDKVKLEYTKLQFRQEESEANRVKFNVKDINGNMMTLLGVNAEQAIDASSRVHNITEIDEE